MNLEKVYPNPNDPSEEMSFEELRAQSRGWTDRNWTAERSPESVDESILHKNTETLDSQVSDLLVDYMPQSDIEYYTKTAEVQTLEAPSRVSRTGRTKKMKVMEVKVETQTGK